MRREINSPAIRITIPENPLVWIDSTCSASDGYLIDRLGNTYNCNSSIVFYTDGFSYSNIIIGQSYINNTNFSLNFWISCSGNSLKFPIIIGDRSENGFWLEIQGNLFRWRSKTGTLFSDVFDSSVNLGISKAGTTIRFFQDGIFKSISSLSFSTENITVINSLENDKINNLFIYARTLSDIDMNNLCSYNFQISKGFDVLGYMNSFQSFSVE